MVFIILDHAHNLTNHIYYTADIKFYYNGRDEDMVSPEGCCNYELAISSVVTLGSREKLYGPDPIVVENNEDEDDDVEVDSRAPTRYGEDDGANDYQEDEDRDYVCCDYSPEVVEAEDDVKCTLSMYFKFIKKSSQGENLFTFLLDRDFKESIEYDDLIANNLNTGITNEIIRVESNTITATRFIRNDYYSATIKFYKNSPPYLEEARRTHRWRQTIQPEFLAGD